MPCALKVFMMCHRIGLPPISTIGFGRNVVSSDNRDPSPPARITAFIVSAPSATLVCVVKLEEFDNRACNQSEIERERSIANVGLGQIDFFRQHASQVLFLGILCSS